MPSTRSRSSTEAPEVAVEDKKATEEPTEQQEQEEVKEVAETQTTEKSEVTGTVTESDNGTEKPVETEEKSAEATAEETKEETNGDQKVENGSSKRKSIGDEAGDAPDSTDVVVSPKKAKLDAPTEESNGANNGSGEQQETPLESTA